MKSFIHLVVAVEDTPSIIRRIAENRRFLSYCLAAVKAENNTDPELLRLYHELKKEIGRHGYSFESVMDKLSPVAAALGLQPDTPDSIHADYYRILGIGPNADTEAVKKAYRRKAMQSHPDAQTGEKGRFIAVHEAHTVLSDPTSRRFYDARRKKHLHRKWSEHTGIQYDMVPGERFQGVFRSYGLPLAITILLFLGIIAAADFVVQQRSLQEDMYAANSQKKVSSDTAAPHPEKPSPASPSPPGFRSDTRTGMDTPSQSDTSNKSMTHIQRRHAQIAMYEKAIQKRRQPRPPARDEKNSAGAARARPLPSAPVAVVPKEDEKQPAADMDDGSMGAPADGFPDQNGLDTDLADIIANEEKSMPEPSALPRFAEKAAQDDGIKADGEVSERARYSDRLKMTEKLKKFLSGYCSAYENLDLDRFLAFFAPDAIENGKPFHELLPRYKTNFTVLESMHYTIQLSNYVMDSNRERIEVVGHFSVQWQKKEDKRWHQHRGKIHMALVPRHDTFAVQELTYRFTE